MSFIKGSNTYSTNSNRSDEVIFNTIVENVEEENKKNSTTKMINLKTKNNLLKQKIFFNRPQFSAGKSLKDHSVEIKGLDPKRLQSFAPNPKKVYETEGNADLYEEELDLPVYDRKQKRNKTLHFENFTRPTNYNINININQIERETKFIIVDCKKEIISESFVNKNYDSDVESAESKSKKQTNQENYQPDFAMDEYEKTARLPLSPSKKWRKIKNFFRSVTSFRRHDTKSIESDFELDNDMQDYKDRLFSNTIKIRQDEEKKTSKTDSHNNQYDQHVKRLAKMNQAEKEAFKKYLRESIFTVITEGEEGSLGKIQKFFQQDPTSPKDYSDLNNLFNQPLENGATIFYAACREGRIDLVEYFLNKNICPFVKARIGKKEYESPLSVSARWGYTHVVDLLLEKVNFKRKDAKEALKGDHLSSIIKTKLIKFVKKNSNMFH